MFLVRRLRYEHTVTVSLAALLFTLLFVYFRNDGTLWADGDDLTVLKLEVVGSLSEERSATGKKSKLHIESDVCHIPLLSPNTPELAHFFHAPPPLECKKNAEADWAFIDDKRRFQLIPERKDAKCRLSFFERVDDFTCKYGEEISIASGEVITGGDFFLVNCHHRRATWSRRMMTISPLPERLSELREKMKERGGGGKKEKKLKKPLSVVILSFDSLSQMTFRRKLPKTTLALEQMDSVILNGYNIVGDGTPAAFLPILTGKTELELPQTRKHIAGAQFVDDAYPFIWRNFSDRGYATLYGEDTLETGIYQYRLKGFRRQPTEHLVSTYFAEHEKQLPFMSNVLCAGSEPVHEAWLRVAREFLEGYSGVPRFALLHHGALSHDDINLVEVLDDFFAAWLKKADEEDVFDDVLLVVMADHGHRFAELRQTYQGQLEERLPFMSLRLPRAFRATPEGNAIYTNLLLNVAHFSTPFDIYATLWDVLNTPSFEQLKQAQTASSSRGLSLFRPLPEKRSCEQAGADIHWCTCVQWQEANLTTAGARTVSSFASSLVQVLNGLLESQRALCAPLRHVKIISAKKLAHSDALLRYADLKDDNAVLRERAPQANQAIPYQLQFRTEPLGAVYEATVGFNEASRVLQVDLSAISRLNKYGDAPHCILASAHHLAPYCVCYDRVDAELIPSKFLVK